ncbi:nucleotidyltransferase domain-containing protein [Nitratifractor sp.]|uniref:type VII toxin-antitoxin system MntA family adenylyltransferase antitoxin n=1 Tax=Nitratifractor sp. TaxID=2268144 RepID=UPI0025EFA71B|nr:nucleotidyltransferase domain-containing protein [Nitratifractor sp.]
MKEKIREVLEQYSCIDFALLFGSAAKGKMHPMSDVDIAISTEEELGLLDLGRIIAELESALEKPVDLLRLDDLPRENPKLAFSIVNEHIVLLQRREEKYYAFKEAAYRYYFDQAWIFGASLRSFQKRVSRGTLR